jgi:hypothetical protein
VRKSDSPQASPAEDITAADWLMERLWEWQRKGHPPVRVGAFVPSGFEAYARLFHPMWLDNQRIWMRWSEMAHRNGREMHAEISFWELVRPDGASPDWSVGDSIGAEDGSFPEELRVNLAEVLTPFTSTPDRCWFGVWEGWGDLPAQLLRLPKARAPFGRRYVLFSGPVTAIHTVRWSRSSFQSPSVWWPDDRAWCVSTEIDAYSTFVAGSEACIETVLRVPTFEAMRTRIDARGDLGPYVPRDE